MQKYKYTAVNIQNQKIKGTFIAENEKDLAEQLANQGLFLVSSSLYSDNTPSAFFTLGVGGISSTELTTFCRQFAIMLNTSVPLLECLDILKNQSFTAYFRKIIDMVYDDVKGGVVLSEALNKHKKVFPEFFRSMVYVGEMSGKLDKVFNSLAEYYEKDSASKQKLKAALSYPIILFIMIIGVAIVMLAVIVPTFKDALAKMDVEISGLTKAIYDMSDFLVAYWRVVLITVIALAFAIFIFFRTERGKYVGSFLAVKIPLLKTIQINTVSTRFARAFALLLSSGMDLTDTLDAVEVVITNRYMKKHFRTAASHVRHGMSLTNAFESVNIFPSMLIKMIMIGEKTNSLDDVLTRSCSFFDMQLDASFNSFSSKVQPIMIILLGVVVGTMFAAIYSPMLSIMSSI